jgi:hypothetical protein
VGTVIWHVTMSLDGFIAGPNDSMDWVVAQWSDGGENTRDIDVQRSAVADEVLQATGAILGGRRWYDVALRQFNGYDGIYGGQWKGPVFVLTHRPPDAHHHPAITFKARSSWRLICSSPWPPDAALCATAVIG